MPHDHRPSPERWATFRFALIGPLLAAPPAAGELATALATIAAQTWRHPITDQPVRFGTSTLERWYYLARRADDPVGRLRRRRRSDAGRQKSLTAALTDALRAQYRDHPGWSAKLHADNLVALAALEPALGAVPSYATIRRYLRAHGLDRRRRIRHRATAGAAQAAARLAQCEVRSYEVEHVQALWHLDFHHGSRKVLTRDGRWQTPKLLGLLDDRSRLACHVQWYLDESVESLVHGVSQAIQKRGLPRALMTDNGAAMRAAEFRRGLTVLGIHHEPTLPYSPYQNAKQESFWSVVEGRLVAMLEGVTDLTLATLNEVTQVWVEGDYHREVHSEIGTTPLRRWLDEPNVGRESPDCEHLRSSFRGEVTRTQRRSDGTVSLAGRRFEIPARYRHLVRVRLRYASWDLAHVDLVDPQSGVVLAPVRPLDKARNADGERRRLPEDVVVDEPSVTPAGLAPLLKKLLAEHAATGLPPAYLPKHDTPHDDEDLDP